MTTRTKEEKTVAILSRNANLGAAIQAILTPRLPGASFITISKLGDIPSNGRVVLASLGLPNYLPTDRVSEVISVNTSYVEDDASRKAQWDMLRNEASAPEDIMEILGSPDSYQVIPSKRAIAVRADFAEARAEFAEASNPQDGDDDHGVTVLERKLEAMMKQRDLAISVSALK